MKKHKILIIICVLVFGTLGIYLTFFSGNTNKYDSKTKAYRIDPNERLSTDDDTTYYPIYYFKVNEKEYQCQAKTGSSFSPNEKKNIVYYDSKNPEKCLTQYEKSTSKTAGIIIITVSLIVLFIFFKNPSSDASESNQNFQIDPNRQNQIEETSQKVIEIIYKAQLIYKRVIIGIIILVLLVLIIIDSFIIKQTIESRNYIETTAIYVDKKSSDDIFDDYIYTFKDKYGKDQEIILIISKDETPKDKIIIKYNEKNPEEYYTEGSTMNKTGIIWFIVKIVALILLTILFLNKNLLNKINISTSRN